MKLIDVNCLNKGYLVSSKYESDFVTLPYHKDVFADKDTFDSISNLFVKFTDFEPTVAPNVVVSTQGMLQKVLPLRGYRKDKVLFVMWGGYSNKDHWFEVPRDGYEVDTLDGITVAVLGDYVVEVVPEPNNLDKKLTPASKLSDLEVGPYKIDSVKSVSTKFGDKSIVVIQGNEYWANKQLTEFITMLGNTNISGMTLNVISKGKTASGHPTVKVGLSM